MACSPSRGRWITSAPSRAPWRTSPWSRWPWPGTIPKIPPRAPVPAVGAPRARREPPRLGIVRDFFWEKADPAVARATDRALEQLEKAGARLEDRRLPASFATGHAAHRIVMKAEMAEVHRDRHKAAADRFGPRIRGNMEAG